MKREADIAQLAHDLGCPLVRPPGRSHVLSCVTFLSFLLMLCYALLCLLVRVMCCHVLSCAVMCCHVLSCGVVC